MNCSIIIVSYNSIGYLRPCLQSIESLAREAEVIVVDNQSSDGSQEMVGSEFPWVRLFPLKNNIGFSAANNLGAASATREFIFLLNPDTELHGNAVSILMEKLINSKEQSLAGPKLLNTDGTVQGSVFKFPTLRLIFLELFFLHTAYYRLTTSITESSSPVKVDALSGAAIMLRKSLYTSLGGLDISLFWMEDMDLCFRAGKVGAMSLYVPEALIVHHGGKSSTHVKPRVTANQLLSRLKYFRKHRSKPIHFVASFLIFLHILSRILVSFLLSPVYGVAKSKLDAYQFTFRHYLTYLKRGNINIIT